MEPLIAAIRDGNYAINTLRYVYIYTVRNEYARINYCMHYEGKNLYLCILCIRVYFEKKRIAMQRIIVNTRYQYPLDPKSKIYTSGYL